MVLGPVAGICIFFAHKLFLLNFICSSKEIQKAGGERHSGSLSFRSHGKKIRPKAAKGSPILSGGFNFTREHAVYVVGANTYIACKRLSSPVKRSRIFLKLFQIASNPSGNSHLIFRRFPSLHALYRLQTRMIAHFIYCLSAVKYMQEMR